ncbi:MAG: branched-chain amino acid ABC transporter permease [Proteobacteria bacterium]|nr:branched-chain amino acid ABC transporter permease [Pseudomonadota bacterium]MBI3496391.1 branched-chain amino acid ABC transporter permease [Pseudomonadota bacterium]
MDPTFALIQILNGIQYGLLLFLIASGLTLAFGVLRVINLAHGSFYMVGAYLAFWLTQRTGELWLAIVLGLPLALALGFAIERVMIRFLYERDHLQQVLLTYGLILILNELQSIVFGNEVHGVPAPKALDFSFRLTDTLSYPAYRVAVSIACLAVAATMYGVIQHTRLGMVIRAGSVNREMVEILGFDVRRLSALVFAAGAGLAAFAGMIAAPLSSVYPGLGDQVLIVCFVVVVIGGIGSIKGAFVAALLVGLADTFGKTFAPGLASVAVYALMVATLLWRPQGLFGRNA